jgi:hypothetical protein
MISPLFSFFILLPFLLLSGYDIAIWFLNVVSLQQKDYSYIEEPFLGNYVHIGS